MANSSVVQQKTLQEQKHQLVREEILKCAARLFAEKGFHGVSLDEIAAGLGYKKSSIYYYFQTKNELLWQVFVHMTDQYVGRAEEIYKSSCSSTERLEQLIRMHISLLGENTYWTTVFFRDVAELADTKRKKVRSIIRQYNGYFIDAFREGVNAGHMRPIAPELGANAILGAINGMVHYFEKTGRRDVEAAADAFVDMFARGYLQNQTEAERSTAQLSTQREVGAK